MSEHQQLSILLGPPLSLQCRQMVAQTHIDQIAERVERLLARHESLKTHIALLEEQVRTLTLERDELKNRSQEACERIDLLLQQWPQDPAQTPT